MFKLTKFKLPTSIFTIPTTTWNLTENFFHGSLKIVADITKIVLYGNRHALEKKHLLNRRLKLVKTVFC